MPSRARARPAMYNTPPVRNGGFGALQVEAVTNRPLSIARRHLAASQLRMRDIEPDQLTSSEWVRFLVMEEHERDRWIVGFNRRRRRYSDESSTSADADPDADSAAPPSPDKAEEARQEAGETQRDDGRAAVAESASSSAAPVGTTPSVSIWARQFDRPDAVAYSARRPRHLRRAVTDSIAEAPPTYETAVRSYTPPPAYEPRSDDERATSPPYEPRSDDERPVSPTSQLTRRVRFNL